MLTSKPLKNVASVQAGYSFRSKIESEEEGNVAVVQMKDLGEEGQVENSNLVRTMIRDVKERHLVRRSDLVFRSRGMTYTSAIISGEIGAVVVAAPLLRIRITAADVLPEYLNWFINQPSTQSVLIGRSKGTMQKMVGIQDLEELSIPIPPLARQWKIVELASLLEQEQRILHELACRRKQYISIILNNILKS